MLPWHATAEHDPAPRNSEAVAVAAARLPPDWAGSSPRQSTAITNPVKSNGLKRAKGMVISG
jgi:hypothetical protein